ncbi:MULTISPECIES: alkene reductase [Sinorhizobium]|jgi:N-ethylmaleimide reductase|uniref:alkene reductase n=1 Tax=Sinorhizobium TaxID=28105 RepID=UPI0003641D9A|nr:MULTISPECIES: alkene reductase [Sinorhizobium]PND19541.1 alkene reductase [Ensifer sp. MMN_5]PND29467.1 alkene reductase [Sinorhizobium sp. M4_45]
MVDLFDPHSLGSAVLLRNRIVMAPMTRTRTSDGDVPNDLMATYYSQRASAGLLVTEAVDVAPSSKGYAMTPGLYTDAQLHGWRRVTDEVHRKQGKIFAQIWHVGRMSHSSLMPNGEAPWGVTEEPAAHSDVFAHGPDGKLGYIRAGTPRRLETEEISALVATFAQAFVNADKAGFDGVELHAANGYLFEQFMNSVLNSRDDRYGGGRVEDRTRFLLEAVDEAVRALGPGRVGVRLAPYGTFNSMPVDPRTEETLLYVAEELGRRGVAYMHLVYELMPSGNMESAEFKKHYIDHDVLARVRAAFPGSIIWCGGFTSRQDAQSALATGLVDLIAFGRPYIANPDLAERLKHNWPLAEADRSTYYTRRGEIGYTDFATYPGAEARKTGAA